MNKTIRIVLYVLSILTVAGVIAAAILTGGQTQPVITSGTAVTEEKQSDTADKTDENGTAPDGADNDYTSGETENIKDTADAADSTERTSDDTETAANADNPKDSGNTTIILTGDVLFANAFSDRGEPMADKQFTFRCSPSYVKALNEMGVDIVSLANNHTLDYGREALSDTFQALDGAGILYGGAGDSTARAKEVQVVEVNGKRYGFIAVSRVVPSADWKIENGTPGMFTCYDAAALIEVIKEAKQTCDFVTVFPHWGTEYSEQPNTVQRELAKQCMDAGADLIVGAHTHCLEGIQFMDGKPVFYSLGNFIFGQSIDRSAAVKVTVTADGAVSYALIPVYASDGQTKQMDDNAAQSLFTYMESISDNASVDTAGNIREK